MYLLTFVTIIVGIIGIYGQVLAVQTARIAAQQTGLAGAMLSWHAAAVAVAANIIDTPGAYTAVAQAGCSLSYNAPAGFTACPPGYGESAGTVTFSGYALNIVYNRQSNNLVCVPLQPVCLYNSGANCGACTTQYDVADYQFYSILYKDSGTGGDYVVTFVPPPVTSVSNPAPGFITMAGGNVTGFSLADLTQQLRQANTSAYAYGTVTSSGVLTPNKSVIAGSYYHVPVGIPVGSLAVVASPDGF